LKLSSVGWLMFELSNKLDSELELLGWLMQDGLSLQSTSFEGEFSKIFLISFFGKEDVRWMESVVSLMRRLHQ